jgi:hypothetical protein
MVSAKYSDDAESDMNPLIDYILRGRKEGRHPGPEKSKH